MHTYESGAHTLNAYEKSIAQSSNQYLQLNWKPDPIFKNADGGNATVNSAIDTLANSIKSVAPNKIMLAVYHEPENDIIPSSTSCSTSSSGSKGTPSEYRAMWANVRQRFDNLGVTNVVWAMNYMGFSNYDCLAKELWPGNQYVDWILWDPYDGGSVNFLTSMKRFYTWMENNSDTNHAFTSKQWGLGEFGYWNKDDNSTDSNATIFWQQAKQSLINNDMPRVKLYSVFDSSPSGDLSTASLVGLKFMATPTPDVAEQTAFNDFATTLLNTNNGDGGTPALDTEQPQGTFISPTWLQEVQGLVSININATDNVGIASVAFSVDGIGAVGSDATSPYTATWNLSGVAPGQYTIRAKITDTSGNTKTPLVNVVVVQGTSIVGDIKKPLDNRVDIFDLSYLLSKWNTADPSADIDNSGSVGIIDLSMLLSNWTS